MKVKNIFFWLFPLALIIRTTAFQRYRDANSFGKVDNSALIDIIIVVSTLALIFLTLALNNKIRQELLQLTKYSVLFLVFYYLFCIISALWSKYPDFSAYRAIEFLSQFVIIIIVILFYNKFEKFERTFLFLSILSIISTIIMQYNYVGLSLNLFDWHTNIFTASAGMVFIYCIGEFFYSKRKFRRSYLVFYAIISGLLLILGTSSGSFIAVVVGLLIFSLQTKNKIIPFFIVIIVVLIVLTGEYTNLIEEYIFFSKPTEQKWTLTGREKLWEDYNFFIEKEPLIGYGFSVVARIATIQTTNPHNFIYSILLGTGFVGLIIFVVFLFRLAKEMVIYSFRRKRLVGASLAIIVGVVNALSMPLFADNWAMSPSFVFVGFLGMLIIFNVSEIRTIDYDNEY